MHKTNGEKKPCKGSSWKHTTNHYQKIKEKTYSISKNQISKEPIIEKYT